MTASFSVVHGVYRSEWDAPQCVRIDIDHVHQSSRDGEITAEARITSTAPAVAGLIHQARFTVTGTRSRSELAKHCEGRTPGQDMDWIGLVEWASVKTIAAFRQGEPPTYISEAQQPEDDGFLIQPILLGRLPTVWFGDGGTGKSLLALAAALSIQTGEPALGTPPAALRRVAILDWEMDAWEHRKRLQGLCTVLGAELPKILHVPCRSAIWDDTERLRGIVAEHGIGFVVVDSVGMACAGLPLTGDEAAIRFYTALRQLDVTPLCIAHRTKAEDGDQYPFGSVFWHNQARATWYVRKAQEEGEGTLEVAMHNRKANTGRKEPAVGFRIRFEGEAIGIYPQQRAESALLMETAPVGTRMYEFLKAGPATVAQIAKELGVSEAAVRMAFNRGKSSGRYMEAVLGGERKLAIRAESA